MLLKSRDVLNFIGTSEYYKLKEEKFRPEDERDLTKNEAFTLSENKILSYFEEHYENSSLYYRGKPSFNEILKEVEKYLSRL